MDLKQLLESIKMKQQLGEQPQDVSNMQQLQPKHRVAALNAALQGLELPQQEDEDKVDELKKSISDADVEDTQREPISRKFKVLGQ
jgi:hypothetical protein